MIAIRVLLCTRCSNSNLKLAVVLFVCLFSSRSCTEGSLLMFVGKLNHTFEHTHTYKYRHTHT